jgi:nucleotide-binding universal stress UspA family protein
MSIKQILVPVLSLEEDREALAAAAILAERFDARATALIVAVHPGSEYAAESASLSAVLDDLTSPRPQAMRRREDIVAWLDQGQRGDAFEVRDVQIERAVIENEVLAHARLSDLVVVAHSVGRGRRALFEDILFRSARAVLLIPSGLKAFAWNRVIIGWDAKNTAMRAIGGALPLLQSAKEVVVATVDAKPSASGHGAAPGHDLARYLARHGVSVDVRNIDGLGRGAGEALRGACRDFGAELLVMGAYGHSRAAEFVFGGVTRDFLANPPAPLLLAH